MTMPLPRRRAAMERVSPVLREAMCAGDSGPLAPVPLPPLLGITPQLHHALFVAAVEHTCVR